MAQTYNFLPAAPGSGTRYKANPTTGEVNTGAGVYDPLKKMYVNSVSGLPWTGPLGNTGNFANKGIWTNSNPTAATGASTTPVDQRYGAMQVVKNPTLAAGTADLFKSFKEGADALDFNSLLNEARSASGTLKTAYQNEQGATNVDDYAAKQRALDAQAAAQTGQYADTARGIGAEYKASDEDYARKLAGITQKAYDTLPEYDAAIDAIGNKQIGSIQSRIDRNKIAGGNMGLSSGELRATARGVADVSLPLAREKIQRRYDILSGFERPAATEVATRAAQRLSNFESPQERDIYMRTYQDVQQQKQTEQQVQSLRQAVAGMNRQSAEAYLRSLALPAQLIQSVLSAQTSQLGQIGALDDQAYYRGLEYLPGVQPSQPTGYSVSNPPFPAPGRRYAPNSPGVNGGGGGNGNGNGFPGTFNPTDYGLQRDFQPTDREMEYLRDPRNGGRLPTIPGAGVGTWNPSNPSYGDVSSRGGGYYENDGVLNGIGRYAYDSNAMRDAALAGRIPPATASRYNLFNISPEDPNMDLPYQGETSYY